VRSRQSFEISDPRRITEVFSDGDRVVDGLAATYGNSSPTLRRKEEYVESRMEYFFEVTEPDRFEKYLKASGFRLTKAEQFHEEYYRPANGGTDWQTGERVLKIAWDNFDQEKVVLLYTDHTYQSRPVPCRFGTLLETGTRFLFPEGPMPLGSVDSARHLMDRLDFRPVAALDWVLRIFQRTPPGEGERMPQVLSLALAGERSTVKLLGPLEGATETLDLLAGYEGEFRPLSVPLVVFVGAGGV
jgi:hypothetical protein